MGVGNSRTLSHVHAYIDAEHEKFIDMWPHEAILQSNFLTCFTSRLSAQLASTPVKVKPSGDIPGKKFCQRGSPVKNSASPLMVNFHYITLFLLFLGKKWSKVFPGKNK